MTVFRQHDQAPTMRGVFGDLCREWAELNARDLGTTMRRWGRLQPTLAGHTRPADAIDAIDAGDNQTKDALLLALLTLFQDGHQLAGRVVLQAMLPRLTTLARSVRTTDSDWRIHTSDQWVDRHHVVVAEFWTVMGDYPTSRRPRKVAANLSYETLRAITPHAVPELPIDSVEVEHLAEHEPDAQAHDSDLHTVVQWAVARQVITDDEGHLLRTVYSDQAGHWGAYGYSTAARQLGVSEATTRKRCSRVVRRLTTAVRDQLELGRPEVVSRRPED